MRSNNGNKISSYERKTHNDTMKIWHISDTHGRHRDLVPNLDVDIAIHSGDMSTNNQIDDFISWYASLDIPIKIAVAGNHDEMIEKKKITYRDFVSKGILYLEHEAIDLQINHKLYSVFGSPYTPTYGEWSFMKRRSKMHDLWKDIPTDTQLLITHGPPKNILDHGDGGHYGCASLFKHITQRIKPSLHCFGHIHSHSQDTYINAGVYKNPKYPTTFSNASCVEDGWHTKIHHNGNNLTLEI